MRVYKNVFLLFLIVYSFSCTPDKTNYFQNASIHSNSEALIDTTPRITGIGGIFFASEQPDSLQKWYMEKMTLQTDDYGAVFEFRNALRKDELNYLRWSVFQKGSDYLKPGKADFMINYRVNNLPAYIKLLRMKGVMFLDSMQTFDYGKFIHLLDADSNKIELWEPVDSVLTMIGSATNK
jgi:predicted enzyme related to lactoylglutathione lyase